MIIQTIIQISQNHVLPKALAEGYTTPESFIFETGLFDHLGSDIKHELVQNFTFKELYYYVLNNNGFIPFNTLINSKWYKSKKLQLDTAIEKFISKEKIVDIYYIETDSMGPVANITKEFVYDIIERTINFQNEQAISAFGYIPEADTIIVNIAHDDPINRSSIGVNFRQVILGGSR